MLLQNVVVKLQSQELMNLGLYAISFKSIMDGGEFLDFHNSIKVETNTQKGNA
jgi:predicted Co/Zn/Cd cation transporter (cation efflux family)